MKLSASNVNDIFMKCLFKDGEPTDKAVIGKGVMMDVGFNPDRLKENEGDIESMLDNLPDSFKSTGGGGMSFLNVCNDNDGKQWADLHQTMDQLVTLGNAIGILSFLLPKEAWISLPGGMPYIVLTTKKLPA